MLLQSSGQINSDRKQMAKVTPAQARAIANAIVGRRPANAPAPTKVLKNQGTGLSPRERQQVSIRQPVQKISSAAGPKTPGQLAQQKYDASKAQTKAFEKSTAAKNVAAPKPRIGVRATQEQTSLGGTVTKAGTGGRKVSPSTTAQDIKNVVQQRTARQIAGPVKTKQEGAPSLRPSREDANIAARAAQQRANAQRVLDAKAQAASANKQYKDSGTTYRNKISGKLERTTTNVQNPMHEQAARNEAERRVNEGLNAIKKAESIRKSAPLSQSGRLGGNHAGGHGISELEMAQGKTPAKLGGAVERLGRIGRMVEGEIPLP
jgi:hypothetical protein